MRHAITLGLLLIGIASRGQTLPITRLNGTTVSPAEIDRTVRRLMAAANVQGMGLAVLNRSKPVFVQAYGFRNKPGGALLDTATIVYGASLSKAVFGYLVMQLVERKTLDLDKPLHHYLKKPLPEYDYFSDLKGDKRWKRLTARMCLSHTTGLPNVRWFNPVTSAPDTLGVMRIYFPPGTQYAYSGEGFKLLQLAVEEITHQTIEELAQANLFTPLGMTRTGYTWHASFGDDNVAVGHWNDGTLDKKRKRTEPVAGGSMVTTLADYAKFTAHVMQRKGLRRKSYRTMLSPQIAIRSRTQFPPVTTETTTENDAIGLAYGLGWGLLRCPDGRAFFKEGNGGAWKNYNVNFPDQGVSLVILANSENGEKIFQALVEALVGDTCIPWKWQGYVPYDAPSR